MSKAKGQVHSKFQLFRGKLQKGNKITKLASEVEAWAKSAKVAPKSVGIEYLEGDGKLVLSIGYRADEAPYGIKLTAVDLGRVKKLKKDELAALEKKMAAASARVAQVICHELFVTDDHAFVMVFMSQR